MKQLKQMQGKAKEPGTDLKNIHSNRQKTEPAKLDEALSSASNKSGRPTLTVTKGASKIGRKSRPEVRIRKGDMAEFLKNKKNRNKPEAQNEDTNEEDDYLSQEVCGRYREAGCQTVESALCKKLEGTKLTMLYHKEEEEHASGDTAGHTDLPELEEAARARVSSILDRKDKHKDPYLPPGINTLCKYHITNIRSHLREILIL